MSTLFISDLHLEEKRPEVTGAFLTFLSNKAKGKKALYILGDFFEAWIGDDENTPLQVEIKRALKQVSESGTELFFLHGNRDFLIGDLFAEETGATLLSDPTVIDLYGRATLLMHGDSLCTDDIEYQKFRKTMRNEEWQVMFLKRPLPERQLVAQQLRAISQAKNKGKAEYIMDVNEDEVLNIMNAHQADLLIHGHTHRPALHEHHLEDKLLKRIVLGDWEKSVWYLEASENGELSLEHYAISSDA